MNMLENLKSNLYYLNYPGINTMSDEAIAQVFCSANRLNFLTWFYKELEVDGILPTQTEASYTVLANMLYENGFCSSSERLPFVKGDDSLDPPRQILICQRMFSLLNVLKSNKENILSSESSMSIEDLDSFLSQDMNLFPEFGIMKTMSSNERKHAINDYNKEIELLQEEIKILEVTDGLDIVYDTSEKKYDRTVLSDLENEVIKFKENEANLIVLRENGNTNLTLDNLDSTSGKCDEAFGTLIQYFDNIHIINKFEENLSTSVAADGNNSNEQIVEELCKLSGEIVSEYESVRNALPIDRSV